MRKMIMVIAVAVIVSGMAFAQGSTFYIMCELPHKPFVGTGAIYGCFSSSRHSWTTPSRWLQARRQHVKEDHGGRGNTSRITWLAGCNSQTINALTAGAYGFVYGGVAFP